MPKRAPTRIRIEANETLVCLYVSGYRLELKASSDARARAVVVELAEALGLSVAEEPES